MKSASFCSTCACTEKELENGQTECQTHSKEGLIFFIKQVVSKFERFLLQRERAISVSPSAGILGHAI